MGKPNQSTLARHFLLFAPTSPHSPPFFPISPHFPPFPPISPHFSWYWVHYGYVAGYITPPRPGISEACLDKFLSRGECEPGPGSHPEPERQSTGLTPFQAQPWAEIHLPTQGALRGGQRFPKGCWLQPLSLQGRRMLGMLRGCCRSSPRFLGNRPAQWSVPVSHNEGALATVRARCKLWVYLETLPVIIATIKRPPAKNKK